MGRLANRPIATVMIAAPKHVAVKPALNGIPAASIIAGFTAMMYDMARNVVKPPMISVETVLPLSEILKNLSTQNHPPILRPACDSGNKPTMRK